MNTHHKMWERLEQHQPYADKQDYGDVWKKMCKERTVEVTREAEMEIYNRMDWVRRADRQLLRALGWALTSLERLEQLNAEWRYNPWEQNAAAVMDINSYAEEAISWIDRAEEQ